VTPARRLLVAILAGTGPEAWSPIPGITCHVYPDGDGWRYLVTDEHGQCGSSVWPTRTGAALTAHFVAVDDLVSVADLQKPPTRGGPRPGAGRPPVGDAPRSVRVSVFLTPDELAGIDFLRGDCTRSEWLASAAGIRIIQDLVPLDPSRSP
jgi:hypothetical protein